MKQYIHIDIIFSTQFQNVLMESVVKTAELIFQSIAHSESHSLFCAFLEKCRNTWCQDCVIKQCSILLGTTVKLLWKDLNSKSGER